MDVLTALGREVRALRRDGRARILAPVAVGWGLLVGTRVLYPVVIPALRTAFGLGLSTAGLLVTVLWLGSALGQLPGGMLADRYSERAVLAAGPVLVAGGLVLLVSAGTAPVLFVATGVVGLGLSVYPIARITFLSELYPDRIGSALGVTMATGDLGQSVMPPLAGVLAAGVAWQAGLGFPAPLLVLVAAWLWLAIPAGAGTANGSLVTREALARLAGSLRRPTMLFMTVALFLYIFVWQAFSAFYPTYLLEVKGLSPTAASALFGLFFAFGVVVKPVAGTAYDRFGMRRSLVAALVGPIVGLVALPSAGSAWALLAVTALVSPMLGTGAITQSYLSDVLPAESQGTGLGVVRTTAATLGASGPVTFGVIADRGFFDEGYLLLAGIVVVVLALTLRMPEE